MGGLFIENYVFYTRKCIPSASSHRLFLYFIIFDYHLINTQDIKIHKYMYTWWIMLRHPVYFSVNLFHYFYSFQKKVLDPNGQYNYKHESDKNKKCLFCWDTYTSDMNAGQLCMKISVKRNKIKWPSIIWSNI